MKRARLLLLACVAVAPMALLVAVGDVRAQEAPTIKIPNPGVPQMMTLEGTWTRAAYNNEGYAILGYRLANMSVGEEWMLIEFGTTVRDDVSNYKLTREKLSLETPDGQTIPLASLKEYRSANLMALKNREKVQRDSINYFPPTARQACRIGFFSDLSDRAMAWDEVELSPERACLGRLFFQVPGGIKYGQYWLNVKFERSLVRVPFRILTKEEEKFVSKNFKDIRQAVREAFAPKE